MTSKRRATIPEADEPKDRVLHTRIPESLEDAIKDKAQRLRIPVSNLVRNVLEQTFQLVEDVVDDSLEIAQAARRGVERVRDATSRGRGDDRDVYGWQELVLNRGGKAHRGLSDRPNTLPVFLCSACLSKIGDGR